MDLRTDQSIETFARVEKNELEAAKRRERTTDGLIEGKMGNLSVWTREEYLRGGEVDPQKKIALEKIEKNLTAKAEIRSGTCWMNDGFTCTQKPKNWIREIKFDLISRLGTPYNSAAVSTEDYDGPIPGLCSVHEISGAELLAQAVYFSRPEMQWGFQPERFIVIFTDGSKIEGSCLKLDPEQKLQIAKDTHNG